MQVQFVDLTREEEKGKYARLWKQVEGGNLLLPVITVDGDVVSSGAIELTPVTKEPDRLLKS